MEVFIALLVPAPQLTLICIKEALLCHKSEGIKTYNHYNLSLFGGKKTQVRQKNCEFSLLQLIDLITDTIPSFNCELLRLPSFWSR
jgi:hypothetical protein